MARDRYRIGEDNHPYFLTCTVVAWLPIFTRPESVQIVLDSWRFLQDRRRMLLLGYVVMENHLHFIFIASAGDLAKEVGDFKSYTARRIIDLLLDTGDSTLLGQLKAQKADHKVDREYQLWQEGSHPKLIADEAMMRQKLGYMHDNPVKRGYVDDPIHWRYSSARNYAGQPGLIPVMTGW